MSTIADYNFEDLTNEAERLVLDELNRVLADPPEGLSLDTDSILDIAAYALNHVRPMYRINLLGRLYATHVPPQEREEIREAVAAAVQRIIENPRET